MANIIPFRGIFYNGDRIDDLAKVVTPPYDVISPVQQESYYGASEYNIVRAVLGKDFAGDDEKNNKYIRAEKFLNDCLENKILVRDEKPAVYLLEQEYRQGKRKRKRKGFIALVELQTFENGMIKRHEKTLSGPKADRLRLLRECGTNFSPVFTLFEDTAGLMDTVFPESQADVEVANFEGVSEKLWKVTDGKTIEKIRKDLRDKLLFIADGHHRYETALNFQAEMKSKNPRHTGREGYNFTMVYVTGMGEENLAIFPTHRLIRDVAHFKKENFLSSLARYFALTGALSGKELLRGMEESGDNRDLGICFGKGEFYLIRLKDDGIMEELVKDKPPVYRRLNVVILESLVMEKILGISAATFENITYTREFSEVVEKVEDGSCQAGFIVQPIDMSSLVEIVKDGETMPRKSTFFYPKLLSGLVINRYE